MTRQIPIGNVGQIPKGEARTFAVDGVTITIYHTSSGEVFATQTECPHRGGPLADGLIGGATIVCPLHDRMFDLRSGKNLSGDCTDIRTYPVVVGGDGAIALQMDVAEGG